MNSHKCLRIIIRTEGTLQNRCELSVEQESFFYVQAQKEGTVPSPDDGAGALFSDNFPAFLQLNFPHPARFNQESDSHDYQVGAQNIVQRQRRDEGQQQKYCPRG